MARARLSGPDRLLRRAPRERPLPKVVTLGKVVLPNILIFNFEIVVHIKKQIRVGKILNLLLGKIIIITSTCPPVKATGLTNVFSNSQI